MVISTLSSYSGLSKKFIAAVLMLPVVLEVAILSAPLLLQAQKIYNTNGDQ
jgi:hypothetical protein